MNSIGALVAIYRIFGLSRQHDLQKKKNNIVIIPTTKSTTIIPNKIYHLFHGFHAFKNRDGQCFRIWIGEIIWLFIANVTFLMMRETRANLFHQKFFKIFNFGKVFWSQKVF